jgi:hypothetical protein
MIRTQKVDPSQLSSHRFSTTEKEALMFRLRFAALALGAIGLGLICGCLCHPLLGRHAACPETGCCDIGAVPDGEMPLGGSCATAPVVPGNPALLPPPNLAPQNSVPPLTQPPSDRLTPIPRAQPGPYNPNG